ncbi:MAG: STAS domain-containing protein [Clostridia bacterium]|jgi:anti-sigma B factor antagonist
MTIEKTMNGNDMTLKLEGYLDTTTSPDLKQVLSETMDSIDSLTLDFQDLEYVSSAGLRVLLTAHTTMAKKGGMKLLHVNEEIMDSFTVTGLGKFLNVVKD